MWMAVALVGIFAPSLASFLQAKDVEVLSYFGILLSQAALSYAIASNPHHGIWQRIPATILFSMAILWSADTASGYLFDVQINYPWWGVIEFGFLFVMFLNSFIQGLTEKTGCFAYVRKPHSFQDLVATVFGGCFVTTAIEYQGKLYGFRKGRLIELTDFDKAHYDRRNISLAWGEKVARNVGKTWRPWRNCLCIIGG